MPEVLGLVSGAAGLASLSIQLLTSAEALKGFLEDARNAPRFLGTLAFDIETIGIMLKEFDGYPRQDHEPIDALLERCVAGVRAEVRNINFYITRLSERSQVYCTLI